ncbi:MAG: hypothetical protein K0U79_01620 [Gammaproteobacteria bacterium]|nr:hypothetical protein [Gammaproteobacteria bacterium]
MSRPQKLAFIDPGLRKAPFFLELRRALAPRIDCVYYSRRRLVRAHVRSVDALLFPNRTSGKRPLHTISDVELREAIGEKEWQLRRDKALRKAPWLLGELAAFLDEQAVDALLIWNGGNLCGALAIWLARQRGLPVIFAEHGYLPRTTQLDLKGVNVLSSLTQAVHDGTAMLAPDPDVDAALDADIDAYRSGRPMRLADARIPDIHLRDPWVRLSRRIISFVKSTLRGRSAAAVLPGTPEAPDLPPFLLLPFQVRKDTQLALHSPLLGNDMRRFLAVADEARRSVAPDLPLVVKLHPYEHIKVLRQYRDLPTQFPQVHFVSREPITALLPRCAAVITINSTVGFEAMLFDKPVVALGHNFYTAPGLVEPVTSLDMLPDALRRALTQPVDHARRRAFLRYVHARFLVFGSYDDFSERSVQAVATRIAELLPAINSRAAEPAAALPEAGRSEGSVRVEAMQPAVLRG